MSKEKPLINSKFRLEKYPGKGGWTYVTLPNFPKSIKKPFNWRRVKGSIDGYAIRQYNLMPMKDGNLFLPVRTEIRKKIGKEEGDQVHVILYQDDSPLLIPDELLICLHDEPLALDRFKKLSEGYQKEFINWIFSAKRLETRANRIAATINKLLEGRSLSKRE